MAIAPSFVIDVARRRIAGAARLSGARHWVLEWLLPEKWHAPVSYADIRLLSECRDNDLCVGGFLVNRWIVSMIDIEEIPGDFPADVIAPPSHDDKGLCTYLRSLIVNFSVSRDFSRTVLEVVEYGGFSETLVFALTEGFQSKAVGPMIGKPKTTRISRSSWSLVLPQHWHPRPHVWEREASWLLEETGRR